MSRLLPYPLLAACLLVMWVLLAGFSPGHVILGAVLALVASRMLAALQPPKPRVRRWSVIPRLVAYVVADIARSNIAVSGVILARINGTRRAGFVTIPLALRDPTGLALLACIITSTPGTTWVEYDPAAGRLRIHVLDLVDEQAWIDQIKQRYESLLMEIFQ